MMPCNDVVVVPQQQKHNGPPKCWYPTTLLHGVTTWRWR